MSFSQFMTTTQFYLYGRWHCTRSGWETAAKKYSKPDILDDPNLSLENKVFLITGANAGIGREITRYIASKRGIVYMVCRNQERAYQAQKEIVEATKNVNVHVLIGDCGLEADVRRVWDEFTQHQRQNYNLPSDKGSEEPSSVRLDVLICNAGALLNHKTLTTEGVEVTFATHLLFGTYLLGSLALPHLEKNNDGRLIVVSSGGMYNTKFPDWETATSTGLQPYDGQFAYAYAKRGQVLLCEEWAKSHPTVTIVSCHPGWVRTEGVDSAYGEKKSFLEPLRNTWEGSEGIIWLAVGPKDQIKNGEFYLDRSPQPKHLSGPFFTEGTSTKNTAVEIEQMMQMLEAWTSGHRPSEQNLEEKNLKLRPVEPLARTIDLQRYMGDWYVLGNIPTPLEVGIRNGIERYKWDEKNKLIKVTFDYYGAKATSPSQMKMRATVANDPINTHWKLDPKVLGIPIPLGLDYLVLEYNEEEGYCIVGVPDRSYLWIMTRQVPSEFTEGNVPIAVAYGYNIGKEKAGVLEESKEEESKEEKQLKLPPTWEQEKDIVMKSLAIVEKIGYDVNKIIRVPWRSEA